MLNVIAPVGMRSCVRRLLRSGLSASSKTCLSSGVKVQSSNGRGVELLVSGIEIAISLLVDIERLERVCQLASCRKGFAVRNVLAVPRFVALPYNGSTIGRVTIEAIDRDVQQAAARERNSKLHSLDAGPLCLILGPSA